MLTGQEVQDITHVIQLAVAPVFLLTALGTTLSMLVARLARIVDRARLVEQRMGAAAEAHRAVFRSELQVLRRRIRFVHWALTLGTTAAILVCLLIAGAFVAVMLGIHFALPMAILFIGAMVAYTGALLSFLREIFLAIATFRVGILAEADAE
jgi:hypothetical protein